MLLLLQKLLCHTIFDNAIDAKRLRWIDSNQPKLLHDFLGRPVLVFRSTPEASWQGVCKQLLDVGHGAVMLCEGSEGSLSKRITISCTSALPALP